MTETERICRLIGFAMTRAEMFAAEYLESRGLRFCVDFGRDNCIDKAAALMAKQPVSRISVLKILS